MPQSSTREEIARALTTLPGWVHDQNALTKSWKLTDFRAAMAFMVRIGFEAEVRNHHPELFNVYGTVRVSLTTHDAGRTVTALDLELARAIEAIAPA